jgi:surface carbohydrate biosynthesis protein
MKQRVTIVLPIEIKKREFDSRLLLAYFFVKEGYNIIIGDRDGCERESIYTLNCVYIAKSLAYSQKNMYNNFHNNNGKVLILYEEGGFVGRVKTKLSEIESAYPSGMLPFIDSILIYGESYKELLIENIIGLNKTNVFSSGNSRFDLHKPKYHSYFNEDLNKIKKRYGKYILFNGNFVTGNHFLGQDTFKNEIAENQEMNDEMKSAFFERMKDAEKNIITFIEMIIIVSKAFPDLSIIVRPHPGEDGKIYHDYLSQFKNVHITNKGNAYSWIIGAEIVIHQDCTTGIEAVFAEKPVISYIPFSDRSNLFFLATFLSDIATNSFEIIIKIESYLNGKKYTLNDEQKKVLEKEAINYKYYTNELMLDIVENAVQTIELNNCNKLTLINYFKLQYQRSRACIRWIKGKYYSNSRYSVAYEGVKKHEILKRLNIIKKIENGNNVNITVSKRGINTFHLKN